MSDTWQVVNMYGWYDGYIQFSAYNLKDDECGSLRSIYMFNLMGEEDEYILEDNPRRYVADGYPNIIISEDQLIAQVKEPTI